MEDFRRSFKLREENAVSLGQTSVRCSELKNKGRRGQHSLQTSVAAGVLIVETKHTSPTQSEAGMNSLQRQCSLPSGAFILKVSSNPQ